MFFQVHWPYPFAVKHPLQWNRGTSIIITTSLIYNRTSMNMYMLVYEKFIRCILLWIGKQKSMFLQNRWLGICCILWKTWFVSCWTQHVDYKTREVNPSLNPMQDKITFLLHGYGILSEHRFSSNIPLEINLGY